MRYPYTEIITPCCCRGFAFALGILVITIIYAANAKPSSVLEESTREQAGADKTCPVVGIPEGTAIFYVVAISILCPQITELIGFGAEIGFVLDIGGCLG